MKENEFQEIMNATFGTPEEFREDLPDQETLYEWNGDVLYETE